MASSSSSTQIPPPPPAGRLSFFRRILPLLLAANFAIGGYVLMRPSKKESAKKDADASGKLPSSPVANAKTIVPEQTISTEMPASAKALPPPIPEHEQHELFKWMLEEKRKVKPHDSSEKKKIDEEKALLKQIIRSNSIPSL